MSMNNRENQGRQQNPPDERAQPHPPQNKRRKPRRRPGEYRVFRALGITVLLVGLCVFMAYFALQSAGDLLGLDINVFGLRQEDKESTIVVPEGSNVGNIAKILKDAGVVDTPFTFKLYSRLKDMDDKYKPGEYMLNCKMSYDEIMTALSVGSKERQDVVQILFQEGLTVWEMGKKLEEEKVCTADEFVQAMQQGTYEYEFMKQVPKDRPLRFRLLEGYAFPDTYMFFVGEKPDSVAKKFLSNFESKMTEGMYARMKELGLTLDETITLASIIQKEASLPDDMKAVSGVFHNRFEKSDTFPQMQSDVTIFYVEKNIKPFLTTANQTMYDAYNTYKCAGLPVGPICNPGMDAINAALYPDANEYYYFLTDKEGAFYYATTLEEHEQNIRTASKVGGVGGIATE